MILVIDYSITYPNVHDQLKFLFEIFFDFDNIRLGQRQKINNLDITHPDFKSIYLSLAMYK